MELLTANNIIMFILAAVILTFGFLSVTTTKILRAATYLFITLFAIAGLYLAMNYEFIAAVQLSVYAGGIVVLLVFAILLVKNLGEETEKISCKKTTSAAIAAAVGAIVSIITICNNGFLPSNANGSLENEMSTVGETLMGSAKYQYLLPFEASSVLLLACIIGCLVIAQKNKEEKR